MPYADRERQLAYLKSYQRKKPHLRRPSLFVGCDTEGMGEGRDHRLWMVRVGDDLLFHNRPLHTIEMLDFLTEHDPVNHTYVAFGMGYDIAMLLKDLPQERADLLFHRSKRERMNPDGHKYFFPVRWKGFELDVIGKREFRVRRQGQAKYFVMSDVIGFFQCSFVKALEKWNVGTLEQRRMVLEGKKRRATLTMDAEDIAYNKLECELLSDLMTQFRDVCLESGLKPHKWQGAGQLAAAMLKLHNVPTSKEYELPHVINDKAPLAYYGGRFERILYGEIASIVYEYDINSAYPYAYRLLPCLLHSKWTQRKGSGTGLRLCHVKWKSPTPAIQWIGPFPIRMRQGYILFPMNGEGWYWNFEVDAAKKHPGWEITETSHIACIKQCDCAPYDWVEDTYNKRVELGKSTRGYPTKLGLNSCYGKTAQRNPPGPYTQYALAGMITSATRAMLLDALCPEHESNCLMGFATDSITVAHKLTHLDVRENVLGAWEEKMYLGQFVAQSGVALKFVPSKYMPKWEIRSRGYREEMMHNALLELRDRMLSNPGKIPDPVEVPDRIFYGPMLAMAQNRWDDRCSWLEWPKKLGLSWETKRFPLDWAWIEDKTHILTYPVLRVNPKDILHLATDLPKYGSIESILNGSGDPDESGEGLDIDEVQLS